MSRRASNIAKGLAIIMMLWHHLFFSSESITRYAGGTLAFWPLTQTTATEIAQSFKACVAVFVFVTGYGTFSQVSRLLGEKTSSNQAGVITHYSIQHYVSLISALWAILIPAEAFGWISGLRNPLDFYGTNGRLSGALYFVFDLLGISTSMGAPTYNDTWWYLPFAVLLIFLMPVLTILAKRIGGISLLALSILVFPLTRSNTSSTLAWWGPTAVLGLVCSQYDLLNISRYSSARKKLLAFWSAFCVVATLFIRQRLNAYFWLFDALAALEICVIACQLDELSAAAPIAFLGKHSANIFMLHTFIYSYFFTKWVYATGNAWLTLITALALSLACSVLLERLKDKTSYNTASRKISREVSGHFTPSRD